MIYMGLLHIKTPESLNKVLNKFDYGIVDKDGKTISPDSENFNKRYRTLTSTQFAKYKAGVCWDFANFESVWFKLHKYKFKTYYIIMNDHKMYPTHTFLVYEDDGKYKYFESSWMRHQGIHEFGTMNELFKQVYKWFRELNGTQKIHLFEYTALDTLSGLTCCEFMDKVEQKEIHYVYKESVTDRINMRMKSKYMT